MCKNGIQTIMFIQLHYGNKFSLTQKSFLSYLKAKMAQQTVKRKEESPEIYSLEIFLVKSLNRY